MTMLPVMHECFCCGDMVEMVMDEHGIVLCGECEEKINQIEFLPAPEVVYA